MSSNRKPDSGYRFRRPLGPDDIKVVERLIRQEVRGLKKDRLDELRGLVLLDISAELATDPDASFNPSWIIQAIRWRIKDGVQTNGLSKAQRTVMSLARPSKYPEDFRRGTVANDE